MSEYIACELCGNKATETHHIVFKSQAKFMEDAPNNLIKLCLNHHKEVHGKDGRELDLKLKIAFQERLYKLFDREEYKECDIRQLLGIKQKDIKMMLKHMIMCKGRYRREDIIRTCMGGKLYGQDNGLFKI